MNAIFAGMTATFAAIVIGVADKSLWIQICIGLLLFAFLLFAYAAEQITDALDGGDVHVYLRAMLEYNIGVILVLLSIALFLFNRGFQWVALIPVVGTLFPWLKDIYWLLFTPKFEYDDYVKELQRQV